ncbi:XRE family transcriptional regulator [Selenomonas montiformis]|uniref:XRE family transcriptional regulator n=1 Tax=Selenomonas montiformis TaxID=2652285 RepID=UPI003F89CB4A
MGDHRERRRFTEAPTYLDDEACAAEVSDLPKFLKPERKRSLEDLLAEVDDTFSESLLRLIDVKGKTDPEVYKKANVDRKLFSKIRNNPAYKPSKSTALAFAVALELNLDETKDFIGRAGDALSHSSKSDIIVEYFIQQGEFDIIIINETLFAFEQPLLGC